MVAVLPIHLKLSCAKLVSKDKIIYIDLLILHTRSRWTIKSKNNKRFQMTYHSKKISWDVFLRDLLSFKSKITYEIENTDLWLDIEKISQLLQDHIYI